MNIEHLRYFLVVAQTKSINQAAQRLFISQQHLSRIINNLEKQFNATLLNRKSTGILLTKKGEALLKFAQQIVFNYENMKEYFYLESLPAVENDNAIQGKCKVSFPFFFSLFLGDFIQQFKEKHPNVQITCLESMYQEDIGEKGQQDSIHLVIEDLSKKNKKNKSNLMAYTVGETKVSICVNKHSSLAPKNVLTKEDIEQQIQTHYPNVLFYEDITHPNILFTSSNIYQHLDSVIRNQSICVVPNYIHSGITKSYPDVILIPFEKELVIPINIVHYSGYAVTEADKLLMHFIAQYLMSLNPVMV